jgi:hypothetical protein
VLINRYEEAKKDTREPSNAAFLDAFRIIHRRARTSVLDSQTKLIIKEFAERRRASNEMKLLGKMVSSFIEYLSQFRRPYMTNLLQGWLPQLTAESNLRAIQGVVDSNDGVIVSGSAAARSTL